MGGTVVVDKGTEVDDNVDDPFVITGVISFLGILLEDDDDEEVVERFDIIV